MPFVPVSVGGGSVVGLSGSAGSMGSIVFILGFISSGGVVVAAGSGSAGGGLTMGSFGMVRVVVVWAV